jgi:hypothetical protein
VAYVTRLGLPGLDLYPLGSAAQNLPTFVLFLFFRLIPFHGSLSLLRCGRPRLGRRISFPLSLP